MNSLIMSPQPTFQTLYICLAVIITDFDNLQIISRTIYLHWAITIFWYSKSSQSRNDNTFRWINLLLWYCAKCELFEKLTKFNDISKPIVNLLLPWIKGIVRAVTSELNEEVHRTNNWNKSNFHFNYLLFCSLRVR